MFGTKKKNIDEVARFCAEGICKSTHSVLQRYFAVHVQRFRRISDTLVLISENPFFKCIPRFYTSVGPQFYSFTSSIFSRARRQSGHGVGSVIGIEDVGTEKPPMPMSMLLNGGKVIAN